MRQLTPSFCRCTPATASALPGSIACAPRAMHNASVMLAKARHPAMLRLQRENQADRDRAEDRVNDYLGAAIISKALNVLKTNTSDFRLSLPELLSVGYLVTAAVATCGVVLTRLTAGPRLIESKPEYV